ncbi:MAG TPA: hypothetical protein VK191_03325 [Symbiobacteriaceae bacterium]|nr:hypothetical protein [Symbiobacteriaceae bacterium]
MRPYSRGRRSGLPARASRRHAASPAAPALPSSVATALQEMGILYAAGAPSAPKAWRPDSGGGLRAVWQEVEELPRPVLLLLSLSCFLLLLGLIAWQPWR